MQAVVYSLIALASLGVGATAYFGFTFTPIESLVVMVAFGAIGVMVMERTLRQRAENRLEKAIEDLSRLLATDAQAGSVLSQRINTLTEVNGGKRIDALEADISVLGTVVRQIAEAVADIETSARQPRPAPVIVPVPRADPEAERAPDPEPQPIQALQKPDRELEPVIPLELLREALSENRLMFHVQPIITLPQRKVFGYDLLPRLLLEDGELADAVDFVPRRSGEDIVRRIEAMGLHEAITIARRARTAGQPITLFVPLSRASLVDLGAMEQLTATLDANGAVASGLNFRVTEADWLALLPRERAAIASISRLGAGFSIAEARSLRGDLGTMSAEGVRSIRIPAMGFIDEPGRFTDLHASDAAAYLRRFGIDLVGTSVRSEQQILSLIEDGIGLAQGPHIAAVGPVRPDLVLGRPAPALRRVES